MEIQEMPKNMFGYIYKTTCLQTGLIYIGQHKAKFFNKHYLGSGVWFKNILKKYGKKNFKVEVLEKIYTNLTELIERERYYINLYNATDPAIGYNIDLGGNGIGSHSQKTKDKLSKAHLGKKLSIEHKQHLSISHKGIIPNWSIAGRQKTIDAVIKRNKNRTLEERKCHSDKISKAVYCIEDNLTFKNAIEAAKYHKTSNAASIGQCCYGKNKTAANKH